mmetsp:Transcript_3523/g.14387  ORF Transcript_3523/g.14387 Transcript_3523/m.14387 type:complete len:226 (-) Transcript_3523:378-1055(-)
MYASMKSCDTCPTMQGMAIKPFAPHLASSRYAMMVTATGSVFCDVINSTARLSASGIFITVVVITQFMVRKNRCRSTPATTMTKMLSALSRTSFPLELLMLIQTMAMRHELFVSPSSVLYFVVKLGACSTNSRVALPTPMGMMMEMISFRRSFAAVSAMSVSVPPESPPGALRSTAFRMKGTVNTPRMFVVTVSMSAITPLPSADVTSVTPEVKVVGTQAKSARP